MGSIKNLTVQPDNYIKIGLKCILRFFPRGSEFNSLEIVSSNYNDSPWVLEMVLARVEIIMGVGVPNAMF